MKNPWGEKYEGRMMDGCITSGIGERQDEVKTSTDIAWLRRCLTYPDTEKTVRTAIERRLRKLEVKS